MFGKPNLFDQRDRDEFWDHLVYVYNNDLYDDPLYEVINQIKTISSINGNDSMPAKPATTRGV